MEGVHPMSPRKKRKVLCCGDREWTNRRVIRRVLQSMQKRGVTEVVEGECRGADILSRLVAEELGLAVHRHPAKWTLHGKAAGPIRNQEMLDEHGNHLWVVIAFHNRLHMSAGTMDMLERAMKAGIPIMLITNICARKEAEQS
jgi:hypothetical protein